MHKSIYKRIQRKRRAGSGSIIGENACVLYTLFLFLFFPLLDLGAMGLRTFFLWFACNQAAMSGAKGQRWSGGSMWWNNTPSIQNIGTSTANSVANMFSGISINSGYPRFSVILQAIQHSDSSNNQATAATITFNNGAGLPLSTPMDTSQYIPILRVQIVGTVQPFIPIPFPVAVPGLTTSFIVSIVSEQQIEDPNALLH